MVNHALTVHELHLVSAMGTLTKAGIRNVYFNQLGFFLYPFPASRRVLTEALQRNKMKYNKWLHDQ